MGRPKPSADTVAKGRARRRALCRHSRRRKGRFVTTSRCSMVFGIAVGLLLMLCVQGSRVELPRVVTDAEAASAQALSPTLALQTALAQADASLGSPIYLRIFKSNGQDGVLRTIASVKGALAEWWFPNLKRAWVELWVQGKDSTYRLFKSYPVCTYTGNLGPKRVADDKQAPEGFYTIQSAGMNPNSAYYRSMDIGYPNAYDRLQRATGSQIKIHGMCIS